MSKNTGKSSKVTAVFHGPVGQVNSTEGALSIDSVIEMKDGVMTVTSSIKASDSDDED